MTPLSNATLSGLPAGIGRPAYDRSALTPSIVHIGVGGFHRAHQAVYLDDLLHTPEGQSWGLVGVCLLERDRKMFDVLSRQQGLYTVVERSQDGDAARVVGSVGRVLFAPDDPEAVLETMASPACRIVSLTITEGGYYVHQGTGQFDSDHPDVRRDLAEPHRPRCAYGYLAEALERRHARGLKPFTLQSCDNIQGNGDVLKAMFLAFCTLRDPALADWLRREGAFPNSMVDRITPATTADHVALVQKQFGIDDGWPVVCEPFRQWVVEDHFCVGRPRWETVGAQLVPDVLPYEKMKLRLLNASHQALCYIGMLVGHHYAHETMENPRICALVSTMMETEVTPLLPPVPGIDLAEYKRTLIERFANPAIGDQLARIGTEGSARIPKFVLPSVSDLLARKSSLRLHAFTVAAWFRYLTGKDDSGRELPLNDPMADRLVAAARAGGKDPSRLLALREVFSEQIARAPAFVNEVSRALASFYDHGAEETLAAYSS